MGWLVSKISITVFQRHAMVLRCRLKPIKLYPYCLCHSPSSEITDAMESCTNEWPYSVERYMPELEYGSEIRDSFRTFAHELLSADTDVCRIVGKSDGSNATVNYDETGLLKALDEAQEEYNPYEFFFRPLIFGKRRSADSLSFINRLLVKKNRPLPRDANRLRISETSFRALAQRLDLPAAFVSTLTRHHLPHGKGFRQFKTRGSEAWDFWYFLPVRTQVPCTDKTECHAFSTAGNNQMNPSHYIHLPDENLDIRGSQIALYFRYNHAMKSSVVVSVSFMDGRWSQALEEPGRRIREVLAYGNGAVEDPFFVHLVFLTSVARWWGNALNSMNDQLIAHEKTLQNEIGEPDKDTSRAHSALNKILHTMAAHLHRYGSELESLENTVTHIADYHRLHRSFQGISIPSRDDDTSRVYLGLSQISTQFKSINIFRVELEHKINNMLALLFNRMQFVNDKALQIILLAAQEETKTARCLALEMKKDSVSMKTIAVLTMFFLPGTSFAALLALPFFAENKWFADISHARIWVVLTIPSTALAFAYYKYWRKRDIQVQRDIEMGNDGSAKTVSSIRAILSPQ